MRIVQAKPNEGMHHEHVRSDRDNYVTVHQSNVDPDVYTVT